MAAASGPRLSRHARPARYGAFVRRGLVAALATAGVVAIVVGLQPPPDPVGAQLTARLATPLWSPRRVPQPLVDGIGGQRLQAKLDAAVRGTEACVTVADANGPVATAGADAARIPASTLKLLTATAALALLGPDFRYETDAVAAAAPRNGTVDRLWLSGAGDPGIATPEAIAALAADPLTKGNAATPLATLADAIIAKGVRAIPGGIAGDDSRYDTQRSLPQWPARFVADREVGPIGALTVNDGFTGPAGTGPAAADPAVNAAAQLTRLLQARGVTVGPASRGTATAGTNVTTIATLTSPPLRDVLTAFLASSDNLTGEMLVREVAVRSGKPGSTANGVQAVAAKLGALGLPTAGLVMTDGSGLAREDRVTCALLLAVLGLAADPRYATLHDGLAIAGVRGTLAERLRGTALQGRLVAKTGSLAGVSGLAGFVDLARPVRFALLLNGPFPESTGIALREQVARTIAGYPDAPSPEVLVPQPLVPAPPSRRACPPAATAC